MIFCERPWTHMYFIDAERGQVWPCPWGNEWMNMGNILEDDLNQLQQGDHLLKLRESVLDGSFKYCDRQKCTLLANGWLPDLSEEEIKKITEIDAPNDFILAYDETCNHACPSCRKDYFKGSNSYYQKVEKISEKILPLLNQAKYIDLSGRGEIFSSKALIKLLQKLQPEREEFRLNIETNASLFDKEHWKLIEHVGKYKLGVTATVNSFNDTTYRYLNGYANHVDQVLDNLRFIGGLKKQGIVDSFTISMIVQEANFRELPVYVERCLNEFGADGVRIRAIIQFSMEENEYWFKDVFNPKHPCFSEAIDILHLPIMQDKRVWYWEGTYEGKRVGRNIPISRFVDNYDDLWDMLKAEESGELRELLKRTIEGKKYALYGAGRIADYLIKRFRCYELEMPQLVLEAKKKACEYYSIPLIKADVDMKLPEDINMVINTTRYYDYDVRKLLKNTGYKGNIIDLRDILNGTYRT